MRRWVFGGAGAGARGGLARRDNSGKYKINENDWPFLWHRWRTARMGGSLVAMGSGGGTPDDRLSVYRCVSVCSAERVI